MAEERTRWSTLLIWGMSAIIVLAGQIGLAVAMATWKARSVSFDEPVGAIMIDLAAPQRTTSRTETAEPAEADLDAGRAGPQPKETVTMVADFHADPPAAVPNSEIQPPAPSRAEHAALTLPPNAIRLPPARPKPAARVRQTNYTRARDEEPSRRPIPAANVRHDAAHVEPTTPSSEPRATIGTAVAVADVPSAWKSRVLGHLERYKRYPAPAQMRREEGVALLCFTIARSGDVTSFFLVRGTGSDELDQEALAMVARASPLPPPPHEVAGTSIQLVVPVRFRAN